MHSCVSNSLIASCLKAALRTPALVAIGFFLAGSTSFAVFAPSIASAVPVTFSVTELSSSGSLSSPNLGDEITVGIRMEAGTNVPIFAVGASLFGYDENVLDFVSGEAVDFALNELNIPDVGSFFGIFNAAEGALTESEILDFGKRVQIFAGVTLSSTSGDGILDPGLDGVIGGDDAQFRATFLVTGQGFTTIEIGTGYQGDGIVLEGGVLVQSNNARVIYDMSGIRAVNVPEPTTALFLQLGLVGLALSRRRSC